MSQSFIEHDESFNEITNSAKSRNMLPLVDSNIRYLDKITNYQVAEKKTCFEESCQFI